MKFINALRGIIHDAKHKLRVFRVAFSEERFLAQLPNPAVVRGREEFSDPAFSVTREENKHSGLKVKYCITVRDSSGIYHVAYVPFNRLEYFQIGFKSIGFRQCGSLEIPIEDTISLEVATEDSRRT